MIICKKINRTINHDGRRYYLDFVTYVSRQQILEIDLDVEYFIDFPTSHVKDYCAEQ